MESLSQFLTVPAIQNLVYSHGWVWPAVEMVHYIGMALIIGMIGMLDLRILGLFRGIPIGAFKSVVPVVVVAFIGNLLGGILFVTGSEQGAAFYLENLAFYLKLTALFLAIANLMIFRYSGLEAKVYAVPAGGDAPQAAKIVAVVSLFAWVSAIIFGRLLMYNATLLDFLGM